jgi:hypothetical protein
LVERCHCPFIKIELLRDNPSQIDDVFLWEHTVGENSSFDTALIEKHLKRVKNQPDNLNGSVLAYTSGEEAAIGKATTDVDRSIDPSHVVQ